MKRIQFSLRDIFLIVLYCMLLLSATASAWALKLAKWDIPGATVAACLIATAIAIGPWIGTAIGQLPSMKRIATSAIVTCSLILIYAVLSLLLNR
jgi:hypothetical protein